MQDPRNRPGNTLLHEFIKRCTDDDDDLSPCLQAVNLLLNEGFGVNVVNDEGNSPLHIAVTLEPRNEKIYLLTEILRLLLMEVLIMILSTMMVKHPWTWLKLMKLA